MIIQKSDIAQLAIKRLTQKLSQLAASEPDISIKAKIQKTIKFLKSDRVYCLDTTLWSDELLFAFQEQVIDIHVASNHLLKSLPIHLKYNQHEQSRAN